MRDWVSGADALAPLRQHARVREALLRATTAGSSARYAGRTRALARLSGEVAPRRNAVRNAQSGARARCGMEHSHSAKYLPSLKRSQVRISKGMLFVLARHCYWFPFTVILAKCFKALVHMLLNSSIVVFKGSYIVCKV